jgi:hypothetical protein
MQSGAPTQLARLFAIGIILWPLTLSTSRAQGVSASDCRDVETCRQMALDARARGAVELFHDLAWRAIQTGRPEDPELLFLLARAQSLSHRPTDALVVLGRLARMGFAFDALTHEDLRSTRELPGWPAVASLLARANEVEPKPAPAAAAPNRAAAPKSTAAPPRRPGAPQNAPSPTAAAVTTPSPPAAAPPAAGLSRVETTIDPLPVGDAVHFSTERYAPGGLAYDAVSKRFVFGDREGRRLIVVGEGSTNAVDLIRAESARFHDVTALEIDSRRGELWVASSDPRSGNGALHHLQLISGRTLAIVDVPPALTPVRLLDVTVGRSGAVYLLDAAAGRILTSRSATKTLTVLFPLEAAMPTSLAISGDERSAYVAHPNGITHVDIDTMKPSAVTAPPGIDLTAFERIRFSGQTLVGTQVLGDGTRRLMRLTFSRNGRAVSAASVIGQLAADTGPSYTTIVGDDLYYLVTRDAAANRPGDASAHGVDILVRKIPLR